MPDQESEFLIRIKTALEGAGIKLTSDQFKHVEQAVKDSGAAIDKTKDAATDAGKAGKDAGEKITEGAKHAELGHRELREAVGAVGRQFGGLADVGLWLNPLTAGLAATLFLVDKVKEALNESTEAAENFARVIDAIKDTKIKAFRDATRETTDSIRALITEQDNLDAAYARGDTAMENRIKNYAAEKDAVIKIAEAKEQAFEAEMNQKVTLDKISRASADAAIAEQKLHLESMKNAGDEDKITNQLEETKKQVKEAWDRLFSAKDGKAIQEAKAKEEPLKAQNAADNEAAKQAETAPFTASYTDWRGMSQTFNTTIEDLKKRIREEETGEEESKAQGAPGIAERYKHEADALREVLKLQQKYAENLQTIANQSKAKLDQATAATHNAEEQYRRDNEIVRTGDDRIAQLQKELELAQRTNAALEAQHRRAAVTTDATHWHEERQRVQEGHGAPAEIRDVTGNQLRDHAAHERGPAARQDAYDARVQAEQLLYSMGHRGRGQASQEETAAIGEVTERIQGFMQNSETRNLEMWRNFLSALEALDARTRNNHSEMLGQVDNLQTRISVSR